MMTLYTGENVASKIISFSQQEPHGFCILSATGTISSVTLLQPSSPGGTITYHGDLQLVGMSGSFVPTDDGVENSRRGCINVTVVGECGHCMGGVLGGSLIAASPVTLVLGCFMPDDHQEPQPKRLRNRTVDPAIPAVVNSSPEGGDGSAEESESEDDASTSESEDDASTPEGDSDDDDLGNSSSMESSD